MYLLRSIDKVLEQWRVAAEHKPLLLRGARQVGKSSCVRHLAENFDYYIEVNFEKRDDVKRLFAQQKDVCLLSKQLGMLYGVPVVAGKTLIFLDEIQACPEAIKSLWFFKEDYPELHVAAAGSLLEFALRDIPSFGVGRIRSLFLYPMSFDEFLIAEGKEMWIEAKRHAHADLPLFEPLHSELVTYFRIYMMIGGMPASVAAWVSKRDYTVCQAELDDIQSSYFDDFAKYSPRVDPQLLRNTLYSVIQQHGRKFIFNRVEGEYRTEQVKTALAMLCDAGLIKRVSHSAANGVPLGAEVNDKHRRYIFLDSGLMLRILNIELNSYDQVAAILTDAASQLVNRGEFAELVLGWELVKYANPQLRHELYYWENTNKSTSAEVDYLVERHLQVVPIECKSGTTGKMKSLWLFMRAKHLTAAYRCSLENFQRLRRVDPDDNNIERTIDIIPLYAVSNIINA